jgi:hypothetical protein
MEPRTVSRLVVVVVVVVVDVDVVDHDHVHGHDHVVRADSPPASLLYETR